MTGSRGAVVAISLVLGWALVSACGGSSSDSNPSQTQSQAVGTSQATQPASTTASGQPTFDLVITGGLTAEWKTGEPSAGASCTIATDGFAALNLYGLIDNKPYGLIYNQNQYAAGTYTYPITSSNPNNPSPFIQVATTTDSSVDWTASQGGGGNGTAVITGTRGSEVTLALDLDLTGRTGSPLVHVKGSLDCPTS
jgi:hypothetical protein